MHRRPSKILLALTLGALSVVLTPDVALAVRKREVTTAAYHPKTGELTETRTLGSGVYAIRTHQALDGGRAAVRLKFFERTFWAEVPNRWINELSGLRRWHTWLVVPPEASVEAWQTTVPIVWLPHDPRRERLAAVSSRIVKLHLEVFPRSRDRGAPPQLDLLVSRARVHLESGAVISLPGTGIFRAGDAAGIFDPVIGHRKATLVAGAEFEVLGRPLGESPDGREYLRVRVPGPTGELSGLMAAETPREAIVKFTRTPTSVEALANVIETVDAKHQSVRSRTVLSDLENNAYLELQAEVQVTVLGRSVGQGLWLWVETHGVQGLIASAALSEEPAPTGSPSSPQLDPRSEDAVIGLTERLRRATPQQADGRR